jgi:ABC-2 type transport system ATP-binding protein
MSPTTSAPSATDGSPAPSAIDARLAPASTAPLLQLQGLHHRWKGQPRPVLDDVDLALHPGTVTWIGGRNGVGKTTLLRLAAGILLPQRGSVRMGTLTPSARGGAFQRRIGFLSAGDRGLQARLHVSQQLDYWARLAYVARERRAELVAASLRNFDLQELAERRVDRMSMGQRQRLRIAMAFLHEPDVLLLDEPRNSLDEDGYALLGEQIERIRGGGAAVLWCSPRGESRAIACDAGYQLENGRLEQTE